MKKFICFLMLVIALELLPVSSMAEDAAAKVYIPDSAARAGEEATVSVMIENAAGCAGGSFNIVYDNSALEITDCAAGDAFVGIVPNINTAYAEDTIRINWMSSNTLQDGILLKITFLIAEDAEGFLEINVDNIKLSDINSDMIDVEGEGGSVVVGVGTIALVGYEMTDAEGNRVTEYNPGSIVITAKINNTIEKAIFPILITALYKNGELISVKYAESVEAVEQNEVGTVEITENLPSGSGYTLIVYAWDGFTNMIPLCEKTLIS